jgi:hypothetical protein
MSPKSIDSRIIRRNRTRYHVEGLREDVLDDCEALNVYDNIRANTTLSKLKDKVTYATSRCTFSEIRSQANAENSVIRLKNDELDRRVLTSERLCYL